MRRKGGNKGKQRNTFTQVKPCMQKQGVVASIHYALFILNVFFKITIYIEKVINHRTGLFLNSYIEEMFFPICKVHEYLVCISNETLHCSFIVLLWPSKHLCCRLVKLRRQVSRFKSRQKSQYPHMHSYNTITQFMLLYVQKPQLFALRCH